MTHHRIGHLLRFALLAALAVTAFGFVVMHLWNWLLPPLLGVHAITFAEALGLLVLSRILFGGRGHLGGPWRHRMWSRWQQMTPEEREKFREGMRARCGWHAPASVEAPAGTPSKA